MPLMSIIQEYGKRFELTTTTQSNRHGTKWCHSRVYYRIRSGHKAKVNPYIDNQSVPIPGEDKKYESLLNSIKQLPPNEQKMLMGLLEKGK